MYKTIRTPKKPRAKRASGAAQVIRTVADDYGNAILCIQKGNKVNLYLKIKADTRRRNIGTIIESTRTLQCQRNREDHLYRKTNSYGFCLNLLETAKKFDKIRIKDEVGEFLVPCEFILLNGHFLHFLSQGFEKQIFIRLEQIEQFMREPKF